jgi:predicted PurR-regulated permease PerM
VRGLAICSALFAVFPGSVLTVLRVPAGVPLAILGGLCDVIPVVGVILATVPAVLLALTVAPATAGAVLGFYIIYHVVESYYLVPRIYGQRLRLSTLAVLLALLAGHTLQGLIGAVLVLPLVAAYPIIERIWLASYLAPEVVKDHSALAKTDGETHEAVVEAVLQGERHPWESPTERTDVDIRKAAR